MNKYAAEKIASEYYNMGVQLALQNAGLIKTANPLAKALGITAGAGTVAASPALAHLAGMGGTTGAQMAEGLAQLGRGQFAKALASAKELGAAGKYDLAQIKEMGLLNALRNPGNTLADMQALGL